ncbi:SlyB protein [Capnocytophaga canis]|uniref:SlyB protein n=1 Tax=Capnocytophaga canis TaxID=1848903 RepID=UPI001561B71C|nr:SlyB protein [Capnocytophaga canis]
MKRNLFLGLALVMLTACGSTKSPELKRLEAKEEILSLNTKLNNLKIELEKERIATAGFRDEVAKINANADEKTSSFSNSDDASDAAQKARRARTALKKAQKANRNLAKSERKMQKIQRNISKVETKLEKLNKSIEFVPNSETNPTNQ